MEREGRRSNNGGATNSQREKKTKRKELLEKKKAIEDTIRAASSVKDHLSLFPAFHHYSRNGVSVYFESGVGDKLSSSLKQYIQSLLKVNMEGPYGSEWPAEAKVKHREMVAPEARYLFVYEASNASPTQMSIDVERELNSTTGTDDRGTLVGFVHFRFVVEEEIPVLYVYELQLEPHVQGKGLGKFLMQLTELIAHKNRMAAVVLTVQKANKAAMNFYTNRLRYNVSATSPSRVDPLIGIEKNYEILCKAFNNEAKSVLEC